MAGLSVEAEALLRKRYSEEKNAVLAAELGVSARTVARWAAKLGLKKSEEFMARCRFDAEMVVEWMRLCGKKVGGVPKGYRANPAGEFKKGQRAFSGALEEKRVKALRERGMDERRRMRAGQERKTRWRMWEGWKA